jgi:deazaflavin-dependent oxidoreductase (nitroreductase family)
MWRLEGAGTPYGCLMSDFNDQVIAEFRANDGKVGGNFAGAPMLLLHTIGAKSGLERVSPLVYQPRDDDSWVIFASYAGAPSDPAWFGNLVATPAISIEVGAETVPVTARVATGDERTALWEAQKQAMPGFAAYEAKTTREIPVVVLERQS